jgi:hypothetical protein
MLVPVEVLSSARRSTRHVVSASCDLWEMASHAPARFRATNLSVDGVWVEGDVMAEPGERVWLELGLEDDEIGLTLMGVVRRRVLRGIDEREAPGIGVELVGTSEKARCQLDRWLRQLPVQAVSATRTELVPIEEIEDELALVEDDADVDEILFFASPRVSRISAAD